MTSSGLLALNCALQIQQILFYSDFDISHLKNSSSNLSFVLLEFEILFEVLELSRSSEMQNTVVINMTD